ncbi:MAG: hypothetical protein WA639_13900, partial [Candidatus Acidiferrum sp.]
QSRRNDWGSSGKDLRFLRKLRHLLSKMEPQDRSLLLFTVQQMVKRNKAQAAPAAESADSVTAAANSEQAAAATAATSGS